MELSVLYFKGSHVDISKLRSIYIIKIFCNLTLLFFYFFWVFTVCKSACLPVSRIKRVNALLTGDPEKDIKTNLYQ